MKLTLNSTGDIIEFSFIDWILNFFRVRKNKVINSRIFDFQVESWANYYIEIGQREALINLLKTKNKGIRGFTQEETIRIVVNHEFGNSTIVVLYNINHYEIGRLSSRLPLMNSFNITEDILCVPCTSVDSARRLVGSIPDIIADHLIFDRGNIVEAT